MITNYRCSISSSGSLRAAVGRENGLSGGALELPAGRVWASTLAVFVLVRAYLWGVFRSTPVRLWCREPVA